MSAHTEAEARAQELLLAAERDLPELVATVLDQAPGLDWLLPLLDADLIRARLVLSIALDVVERRLAADESDEGAASRLMEVSVMLARATAAGGDEAGSRRILMATQEALGECGWTTHQQMVFAQLFEMVLEQGDVELVSQLSEELLRIVAGREPEPPLRPLLLNAAYVAYYKIEDLALAYRCADTLRPDPSATMIAGFVFQREEKWDRALEVWDELREVEAGPGIPLNRIVVLAKLGKEPQARVELEELLERYPNYWKGLVQRSLMELEQPGGEPQPSLEQTFALAVQEQIELQEVGEAASLATSLARDNGHAAAAARAMTVLERDTRAEVRMIAKYLRGQLLAEQGCHAEASDAFRGALELIGEDQPEPSEMRLALVDALLADGQESAAIEAIEPLTGSDGLPEEAASRLEGLADAQSSVRVRLLRAMANYSQGKLAPAETELTAVLAEQATNSAAHRLRGMVRLSTSMRGEEEIWDKAADIERYLDAMDDLANAAHEADAEALQAYHWAVDRARADPVLRASLTIASDEEKEPDQYRLIEGLEEADRVQLAALALVGERLWPGAAARAEEARGHYERIGMPVEAERQTLLLADLAMRQSNPRDALRLLDDAQELIPLQMTPLDKGLAHQARQISVAGAARGRPSLALPVDNLAFLTRTAMSTLAYQRILRVQVLSALGRHQDALSELEDEAALLDNRERLGLLAIDGGESVRAVMAILRDASEPARALALRDRALAAANEPLRKVSILVTCAGCLLTLGDPEKALATLEEARGVEGVEALPEVQAVIDHTEATIQLESSPGRVVELLSDQVIEALGPVPRRAAGLMVKAEALQALGRPADADAVARRTEELADDHLSSIPLAGDQSIPQQAWQRARQVRCSIAARRGETEELLVLLSGLKGRTLSLQQTAALAGTNSPSPVETTVVAERDDLIGLLNHAALHGSAVSWFHYHSLGEAGRSLIGRSPDGDPKLDVDKTRAALTDARDRLDSLHARAGELPARPADKEPTDLSQVRGMLEDAPEGTALIDVFLDEDRCYLNGLTAGAEPWAVAVACGDAEIRALANQAREEEDWSDNNPVWGNEQLGRIVDAIHEKTSPGDHVVLIRHGSLHELPLHAIEGAAGMLAARNTISYAPGMSALLSCQAEQPATGEAIVIADSLGDLPHARLEGKSVAELMGVPPLFGFQADRRRLLAAVDGRAPLLLHVACHGLFDEADPDASRLALAAGAVDLDEGRDTDLTAREIARLPLQGAVVVLSACHSGVSALKPGDEPFGLTRAFLTAGARTIVAARWAVDDVSTWLLMRKFTELRRSGLTVVEALANSQHWVRALTTAEITAHCEATLREGGEGGAAVVELLNRYYALGLEAAGRGADAEAVTRKADLLAMFPGVRSSIRSQLLKSDGRPFADRKFWAAFEVIGDWV